MDVFKKVLWYFQIFAAKRGDPNKFQSFWEMDEEDVDEESMEEIQSKTIVIDSVTWLFWLLLQWNFCLVTYTINCLFLDKVQSHLRSKINMTDTLACLT